MNVSNLVQAEVAFDVFGKLYGITFEIITVSISEHECNEDRIHLARPSKPLRDEVKAS